MNTGADILRDRAIQSRAARSYSRMYDSLATDAQAQLGTGKPITSAITRAAANIAVRAWESEVTDPDPIEVPWCDCSGCKRYLARPDREAWT